jgi:transporter family protein
MKLPVLDFRIWALGSAVFAGLTAVLAKKGVEGVPSNLALAIRVVVILIMAWAIVFATKEGDLSKVTKTTWTFLVLSGLATGASWLCYFKALQLGPVSKVAPIDKLSFAFAVVLGFLALGEKPTLNVILGCLVIAAGVAITLL